MEDAEGGEDAEDEEDEEAAEVTFAKSGFGVVDAKSELS